MSYQQDKFKEIADAIREKTGTSELIKPSDFASKISDVYQAGQNSGGGGYDEGYADGRQAEYDAFWDGYQGEGGTKRIYQYAFARWNNECYKPKYDITSGGTCGHMYFNSSVEDTLVNISITGNTTIQQVFGYARAMHTIRSLTLSGNITFSNWFTACESLQNLSVYGEINRNGFDVSDSPLLTHESLMSIIGALSDKTSDTSGTEWVCTLGTTNLNKLTATEIAVATVEKGWILS